MKFLILLLISLILVFAQVPKSTGAKNNKHHNNQNHQDDSHHHSKQTKTQFSLPQSHIQNFLNRKPVSIFVTTGPKSQSRFSFFSFISKNSRGILLDLTPTSKVQTDKTNFFDNVVLHTKDGAIKQALLDFRLVKKCKFQSGDKKSSVLQFRFKIESKNSPQIYSVLVKFQNGPRKDLLVNDLKEFSDVLVHLKRVCTTRKNQLRNRKSWFIQKADEAFENVKKLKNGRDIENHVLSPNSPFNIDGKIKLNHAQQKEATNLYLSEKKRAQSVAQAVADLGYQISQAETDYNEAAKKLDVTKRGLDVAKLDLERSELEFQDAKNNLIRSIPQGRKLIEKATENAKNKEHELGVIDLKLHS